MAFRLPFYLSVSLLLAGSLSSCGENAVVNETPDVHANFYVRYLADGNELRGQATFSGADSTILTLPGGVAFMSSGTQLKQLPNGLSRYDGKMRVPFPEPTRFSFQLPGQQKDTEVKLPMTKVRDFSVISSVKQDGLRLALNGTTVAEDESLLLLFTDPNQEVRTVVRPGPLLQTDLFIPPDALALFTTGEYRLYLVKSRQIVGQTEGLTYEASIEYYSPEVTFTLRE